METMKQSAPGLAPKQALGEALACVDRALALLEAYREATSVPRAYTARHLLLDVRAALASAYEGAK